MALKDSITSIIVNLMIEQPAKRQGLDNITKKLEHNGNTLNTRLKGLSDSQANRDKLSHIIAIEKWGQRKLNVALGETLLNDESRTYKPSDKTSWEDLQSLYGITRLETLDIAKKLSPVDVTQKIPHNQFGSLSVLGWLRYLNTHAFLESKRLK